MAALRDDVAPFALTVAAQRAPMEPRRPNRFHNKGTQGAPTAYRLPPKGTARASDMNECSDPRQHSCPASGGSLHAWDKHSHEEPDAPLHRENGSGGLRRIDH